MKTLKSNFAWSASFQILRIIIPLITMPYLARVLTASQLGIYSYTYTVAYWFSLLSIMGLNQYGSREIARNRDNKNELSRTFCSIYAMQLIAAVLVSFIYFLYCLSTGGLIVYSLIWGAWILSEAFDVNWFFFGLEEFKITVIRNFFVKLVIVIAIFLFVRSQDDLGKYCAIQSLGFFVSSAAILPFLRGRIHFYLPSLRDIAKHIKPNLLLFAPVVAVSLYTQVDKILLGALSNMPQVAYYDYAEKISQLPLAVIQALGTVMLPHASNLIRQGRYKENLQNVDLAMWLTSIMAFGFMFGIIAVAEPFIPIFLGSSFLPSIPLAVCVSIMIPFIAWSNVIGVQYMIPAGKDREYTVSVVLGAAINVVANLILIPLMQAMGAVIATVLSEMIVTISQCAFVRHDLPLARYIKDDCPYFFIGVSMLLIVDLIGNLYSLSNQLDFIIRIFIGVVAYGIFTIAWLRLCHDHRLKYLLKLR